MKTAVTNKLLPDGGCGCANCGKSIEPNSQVSVIDSPNGALICHSSYFCSPAGNSRYGFWGDGKLVSVFDDVEQC